MTTGRKKDAGRTPPRRFRVRYARIVLMETTVEARSPEEVRDEALPGVFDGVPEGMVGKHVLDIQDYEFTWQVREADGPGEVSRRKGRGREVPTNRRP